MDTNQAAGKTSALSGDEALAALQSAVKGLLFPSESDKPITAFRFKAAEIGGTAGVEALRKMNKIGANMTIAQVTVEGLLDPLGQEKDWFGPDEKATADRFRKLLALLGQLSAPAAYRVQQSSSEDALPIDVYVIGSASDGDIAGVSTQVVET